MKRKVKKYGIPVVWLDGKPTIARHILLDYHARLVTLKSRKKREIAP